MRDGAVVQLCNYTCELLRHAGVTLLGLGNVSPQGCCVQRFRSIYLLWGMAGLVHAEHMIAQGPILQTPPSMST